MFFCTLSRTWLLGRIMKLPNAHRATVSRAKILGYLLSDTHPRGKSKAVFFKRLGFDATRAESLADELFRHASENEVEHRMETDFGDRYVIDGWIVAPTGTRARIRTVWFVDAGEETPRFVTAHPLRRRR